MSLRTNYKNDVLASSMNGRRQYQMINNANGTVSFVDVTEYTQNGDTFSAGDINATNNEIFTNSQNISANAQSISSLQSRLSTDEGSIQTLQSRLTTDEGSISTNTQKIGTLNTKVSQHTTEIANLGRDIYQLTVNTPQLNTITVSGSSLYPTDVIKDKWGVNGGILKTGFYYLDIGTRSCWCMALYKDASNGAALVFNAGVAYTSVITMAKVAGTWSQGTVQTS